MFKIVYYMNLYLYFNLLYILLINMYVVNNSTVIYFIFFIIFVRIPQFGLLKIKSKYKLKYLVGPSLERALIGN